MATLEQIHNKHKYNALARVAEGYLAPVTAFDKVVGEERGRRYQGFWDELGRSGVSSSLGVASGLTGSTGRALEDTFFSDFARPFTFSSEGGRAIDYVPVAADQLKEVSQRLFEESQKKQWSPSFDGGMRGYVAQALGATGPYMFASALASAATGSPLGAFAVGYGVESESIYRDLPEDMPESQKRLVSSIGGAISGAIEAFQIGEIYKAAGYNKFAIEAMKKAAIEKSIAKLGAATGKLTMANVMLAMGEGTQEALQQMTSDMALIYGSEADKHGRKIVDVDRILKDAGKAFVGGATVGAILSGGATMFKIAADGTVTQPDAAPLTAQEVAIKEEEAKVAEKVRVEKAVEKGVKKAAVVATTPVETTDTPSGTPPLETKTTGSVEQQNSVVSNVANGVPPMTGVVSPKQEISGAILESMGQTIPSREKESFAQWMQEAESEGLNKRESAARIAEEVSITGRALTRQESAGLTMAVVDIQNELDVVEQRIANMADIENADVDVDMASLERLKQDQSNLTTMMANALYESGGEQARDFVARKMMINRAGDLVKVKSQARRNKKAPLTKEENAKFEEQAGRIESLEKEVKALQEKDRDTNADKVFKAAKKQKKGVPAKAKAQEDLSQKKPWEMTEEEFLSYRPSVKGYKYHGSPEGDISSIDPYFHTQKWVEGIGFYTTNSRDAAAMYAEGRTAKGERKSEAQSKGKINYIKGNPKNPLNMDANMDTEMWNKIASAEEYDSFDWQGAKTNRDAYLEMIDAYNQDNQTSEGAYAIEESLSGMGFDAFQHMEGVGGKNPHQVTIWRDEASLPDIVNPKDVYKQVIEKAKAEGRPSPQESVTKKKYAKPELTLQEKAAEVRKLFNDGCVL